MVYARTLKQGDMEAPVVGVFHTRRNDLLELQNPQSYTQGFAKEFRFIS